MADTGGERLARDWEPLGEHVRVRRMPFGREVLWRTVALRHRESGTVVEIPKGRTRLNDTPEGGEVDDEDNKHRSTSEE